MPKRVVVTEIWNCSLCPQETDAEKITQFTLKGDGKTLTYDVCATCKGSEPFASFLTYGLSERAAGKTLVESEDGKTQCLYCPKRYTETGMGMHMAAAHGVKSKTQQILETRGKTGRLKCPECDFRSNAPQGIAAHRSHRHGITAGSGAEVVVEAATRAGRYQTVTGHPCPDCPEFVAESAQGLGAHRRHVHPGAPKLGHGHKKAVAATRAKRPGPSTRAKLAREAAARAAK